MRNKVRLKKGQVDYFRKQCRETPNEILAYLIGTIVTPNLIVIDELAYTQDYHISTPVEVCWNYEDKLKVTRRAEERGKSVVGFIHSHPNWDAVLSPSDYVACITDQYRVCGIVSTDKKKTRVRFWVMDSALSCEIVYHEKKKRAPANSEENPEQRAAVS